MSKLAYHRLVIVLLVIGFGFAFGSQQAAKIPDAGIVRSREYQLIGDNGETLFTLKPAGQGYPGAGIAWRNEPNAIASIFVSPDGAVWLQLTDVAAKNQARLSVGLNDESVLAIGKFDPNAKRAQIGVTQEGKPFVVPED